MHCTVPAVALHRACCRFTPCLLSLYTAPVVALHRACCRFTPCLLSLTCIYTCAAFAALFPVVSSLVMLVYICTHTHTHTRCLRSAVPCGVVAGDARLRHVHLRRIRRRALPRTRPVELRCPSESPIRVIRVTRLIRVQARISALSPGPFFVRLPLVPPRCLSQRFSLSPCSHPSR